MRNLGLTFLILATAIMGMFVYLNRNEFKTDARNFITVFLNKCFKSIFIIMLIILALLIIETTL